MEYKPTIGLEIHAELKTRTKMFCDSLNDPSEFHPNQNVCPVCLGHPGTLPTINKLAVENVLKVGLALGGAISPIAKFDRKNYFYPDLPKGYQISQYDQPLVTGGELLGKRIRRIHLEEDAGNLIHDRETNSSFVDFNRAGVPLLELVTEPDFISAEEAVAFARELQLILRYLGASDADMEKGQMRIEANVSLGEMRNEKLEMGTKVEIKNINSFKAARAAIDYEIKRQAEILDEGKEITQETRGWDEQKQKTVSQRSKEEAHDYRYFPEPDLPPFETSVFDLESLKSSLPELPQALRERFKKEYGLDEKRVSLLVENKELADYYEQGLSELDIRDELVAPETKKRARELLFNYATSDLLGIMNDRGEDFTSVKIQPEHLAHTSALIAVEKIGSRQAKDILARIAETGLDPEDIIKSENLSTISDDSELQLVVSEVVAENINSVADYKKGKTRAMQFLIGKAMAKLKGRGDPKKLGEIIERTIKSEEE
ncbi:MAG: Asp-tRNA(Asn)/Glu-tRNA(Gln) amidotransferase subunit GatB [Parcubacteria group bacterium]|nr:Asp-tRNA(Asn)/Glu-tRNA(Gln) amidotransferase subunit GatB [Parcubacteria group bacterium]